MLVTFPEPPAQHDHQEQGDHLLDESFVTSVHRLLKPGGEFVIVTDNLPYAKVVAAATFKVGTADSKGALFADVGQTPTGGGSMVGVNAGVPVGFVVDSARADRQGGSFFDRLWAGRGKSNRFFIQGRRLGKEK